MPMPVWPTPSPAGDYYTPEPEPKGLLSFLGAGPDFGADVGDRMGVIAQILMNAGSGRGGAGIAEATAAANERSSARREKRKAERMVNRAADKIEGSNPEMAAMMRANTAFGMQMIGKQYESEWSAKNREAELRQEYGLKGELETAKLQEAARIREASSPFLQMWRKAQAGGGAATPANSSVSTPAEAMPGNTQAPAYDFSSLQPRPPEQSVTPAGMDVATGTQPIPDLGGTQAVQPPAPQVGSSVQQAVQQPATAMQPPLPPISRDPTLATMQKNLLPMFGPLYEDEVQALMAAEQAGGTDTATVIQAIGKRQREEAAHYRGLQEKIDEENRGIQTKSLQEATTIARQEALPGQRQDEFRKEFQPVQGSITQDLTPARVEMMQTLHASGFSDKDIAEMPDPEAQAKAILSGVGQGPEGRRTATAQAATDLDKNRVAVTKAQKEAMSGRDIRQTVERIKKTIPTNRKGEYSASAEIYRNQLDNLANATDNIEFDKGLTAATAEWRQSRKDEADIEAKNAEIELKVQENKRAADKVALEAGTEAERVREEELFTLQHANDGLKALDQMIDIMQNGENSPMYGMYGWAESFWKGSPKQQFEAFAETARSLMKITESQKLKKFSRTGSGLGGSTSDKDMGTFETTVSNLEGLATTKEGAEFAMKTIANHFLTEFTPDSGDRYLLDTPGFVKAPFDLKRDNYPEYILRQRDSVREKGGKKMELE